MTFSLLTQFTHVHTTKIDTYFTQMIKIYSAPAGTDILKSHQMPHKHQTEVYTMQFKYVPSKHCLLFCGSIILLLPLNKQIAIQRLLFIFALSFFLWNLFLSLLDYAVIHIYKQDYHCELKLGSLRKNKEKRALKVHVHWGKANIFLLSLSLHNMNIKFDSLWTHQEVMSPFLSCTYKRDLRQSQVH